MRSDKEILAIGEMVVMVSDAQTGERKERNEIVKIRGSVPKKPLPRREGDLHFLATNLPLTFFPKQQGSRGSLSTGPQDHSMTATRGKGRLEHVARSDLLLALLVGFTIIDVVGIGCVGEDGGFIGPFREEVERDL